MAAQSTSSKALLYFSERVEDATEAVKGLLSGRSSAVAGINGFGGAAGASSSSRYLDISDDALRLQLESDRDDLRISGLRTIIAHISKGHDAAGYFASVVKLSSNQNLEIRKLVYCIVRRYARKQPDIALLGINSFQRDLLDRNEVIRMMALRVLTGLRLKVAASVVEYAINRSVRDTSFHVRRAAALSLIKCRDIIGPDSLSTFRSHVATLLQDRHPSVLGAALVAWRKLFSNDISLLHQHFRKLCYALGDMDEWAQHESVAVLAVYAKRCFVKASEESELDPDYALLLNRLTDLLSSRNAAVVILTVRALDVLGRTFHKRLAFKAACRYTTASSQIAFCALIACHQLTQGCAEIFQTELSYFYPRSSAIEHAYVTTLKLKILVTLSNEKTYDDVLGELVEQSRSHPSERVASIAVRFLGSLASNATSAKKRQCIHQLLLVIRSHASRNLVVSEALAVIGSIVEASSDEDAASIVLKLSSLLFTATSPISKDTSKKIKIVGKSAVRAPLARGHIYWLLGQYCRLCMNIASASDEAKEDGKSPKQRTLAELVGLDVLRLAAINFTREDTFAKLQIVTLSTKLVTVLPQQSRCIVFLPAVLKIHAYLMQLARYDESFDVRDRARFCKALTDRFEAQELDVSKSATTAASAEDKDDEEKLGGVVLRRSQAEHILFEGKTKLLEVDVHDEATTTHLDVFEVALGRRAAETLLPEEADFEIETWADADKLPPSEVREPSEELGADAKDTLNAISTQKSLSSADWTADGTASGTHTPIGAHPHADLLRQNDMRAASSGSSSPLVSAGPGGSLQSKQKYRDLDDFLNASSSSEDESSAEERDDKRGNDDEELEEEEEETDEEEEEETDEEEEEDDEDVESEKGSADNAEVLRAQTSAKVHLPIDEENAWAS